MIFDVRIFVYVNSCFALPNVRILLRSSVSVTLLLFSRLLKNVSVLVYKRRRNQRIDVSVCFVYKTGRLISVACLPVGIDSLFLFFFQCWSLNIHIFLSIA